MTIDLSNPSEATDLFLRLLVAEAYDGAVEGTALVLEKGPAGRKPASDLVTLHRWFQDLDDESREQVLAVIRLASDAALFHCLVLIDDLAGYPIPGKVSDFAVYLQTYASGEARAANSPQTSVRVNPTHATEFLHDMFHQILQERVERKASQSRVSGGG